MNAKQKKYDSPFRHYTSKMLQNDAWKPREILFYVLEKNLTVLLLLDQFLWFNQRFLALKPRFLRICIELSMRSETNFADHSNWGGTF